MMTKHLFNYCPINLYEDKMKQSGLILDTYIEKLGLDGIEQYIYKTERDSVRYIQQTVGVHLNYWAYWMDFWLKKTKEIKRHFPSAKQRVEYYGQAMNREEWLSIIRRNICNALQAKPEYLVWHVAEANNKEIFTYQFNYSDREVLCAASDVFNAVADEIPDNVTVLFENLWWPGLRLTDARNVKYFFNRIERKNVGIMLDTGHLMNTNINLNSENDAAEYVCNVIDRLGNQAELIKGVHLNCSLSGQYQKSFTRIVPRKCDNQRIWQHVTSIDQHRPFSTKAVQKILACIEPRYIVHELSYTDLDDMYIKVNQQIQQVK